jgi:hypothetical protein
MRHLAYALAAVVLGGCRNGKVTAAECTKMLDRYVDMTIAGEPGLTGLSPAQMGTVREMKRAVKKNEKSYRRVHDQCEAEVVRREYDCAMDAKTPNDWEACID